MILAIDLETYSELDIKKVGLYKYAENSEVLLFAYAFDDEEVKVFALIEKDALGNYMVILNPFDTNTLFDVDVDVLSILGFNN